MANVRFYNPRTYNFVRQFDSELVDAAITAGLHGSLGGKIMLEVTPANTAFIDSLHENSHFLAISVDEHSTYGAVIESAIVNKGICTVELRGFYEYLGIIPFISSHKMNAMGESTVIPDSDPSWTKYFYSSSPVGLLYDILMNLAEMQVASGYAPFFDAELLRRYAEENASEEWAKSYRLNSTEFPSTASIVDDIFKDTDLGQLKVTVNAGDRFQWVLDIADTYSIVAIAEAYDAVKEVTFEPGDTVSRTFSYAVGTNLQDQQIISKQDFDSDVAFSGYVSDAPADRTSAIERINYSSRADAEKKGAQISFKTFDTSIQLLDAVSIGGTYLETKFAVVTQIAIEGTEVTYTGQCVTDASTVVKNLRKPTGDVIRRLVYKPVGYAVHQTKRTAFKQPGSTGWRS